MQVHRFRQWKKAVSYSFADPDCKEDDPWWQIKGLFEAWNRNRSRTVQSSNVKIMDESMSAFRPQTTPTGNLPHLSFIQHKPEPIGTELKVAMCADLQVMTCLSLCRGKKDETSTDVKNMRPRQIKKLHK